MSNQLTQLLIQLRATCPYCNKAFDNEHVIDLFKGQFIIGCPQHPKEAWITVIK